MTTPTTTTTTTTMWYELYARVYSQELRAPQNIIYFFDVDSTSSMILNVYTPNGMEVLVPPSSTFNDTTRQFSSQGIVVCDNTLYLSSPNPNKFVVNSYNLKFTGSNGYGNQIYSYDATTSSYYLLNTATFRIWSLKGPPPFNTNEPNYRWYGLPDNAYEIQKQIQDTVRVPSSLYMDNLASLAIYQYPANSQRVNWNQSSDRAVPHNQKTSTSGANSTRGTVTRCRPNAGCPGGSGCDIKHNSYARYLGRLKGKGLKSQPTNNNPPPTSTPTVFNPAFPIYGNKKYSTNIITSLGVGL